MRYPPEVTAERHDRILDEAMRLYRERGFFGVGVSEIMKAAGLTHGPFYNHFESKEALMAEGMKRATGETLALIKQLCEKEGSTREFLDEYLSRTHRDSPGTGCAIPALASEVARLPAPKREFTAQAKQMVAALSAYSSQRTKAKARSEAIQTLAAIVGAVILSRASDDPDFADEILHEVRRGLDKL